jgi:hypothetical protein
VISFAEHWQLVSPGIPKLRETVKKDYEIIPGPAFSIMQTNVTNICETVTNNQLGVRSHNVKPKRPATT